MKDNLKEKTIGALLFSAIGFLSNGAIQFILGIVQARLLSPKDYGLLGMILVFIGVSEIFVNSGMTTALVRETEVTDEDYSTVFYYNLGIALITYIILYIASPYISLFFNEKILTPLIRVLGLNLIIGSFGLIQRTMLERELDFKTQSIVEIIAALTSGLIAVYLAYIGFGVWSLVFQKMIQTSIVSVLFMVHNKWKPLLKFNIKSFKKYFTFGWKMLATGVLATIYQNIYNLIIGRNYASNELGYYTKSKQTVDMYSFSITSIVGKVSYPALSKIQDDKELFTNSFRQAIRYTSFVTFPIMVGLVVIAKPFVILLFGSTWEPMVPYFQILALSNVTLCHRVLNLSVLQVKGRSDLFLGIDLFKMGIGMISILMVVYFKLGIKGLLITIFINSQIAFFVNSFFSKKLIAYSTKDQFKDLIPSLSVAILMGLITHFLVGIIEVSVAFELVLKIITGIISYISISIFFGMQESKLFLEVIVKTLQKMKNRRSKV